MMWDEGESASRALSHGAHLIPFNSFWSFSTLSRFITFSGDGWQTFVQKKRIDMGGLCRFSHFLPSFPPGPPLSRWQPVSLMQDLLNLIIDFWGFLFYIKNWTNTGSHNSFIPTHTHTHTYICPLVLLFYPTHLTLILPLQGGQQTSKKRWEKLF